MSALIIGIIVVAVLLLGAALWVSRPAPQTIVVPPVTLPVAPKFSRQDAMSYIYGLVLPKGNSGDGNVKYLGDYTSQDGCETACGQQTWCKGYTWHDGSGGTYANQCYGLSTVDKKVPQPSHMSGDRIEGFDAQPYINSITQNVGTFSNTLQRRLGMSSAAK